eukprot:1417244-Pyramimonas_sp.AAC.1
MRRSAAPTRAPKHCAETLRRNATHNHRANTLRESTPQERDAKKKMRESVAQLTPRKKHRAISTTRKHCANARRKTQCENTVCKCNAQMQRANALRKHTT